MTEQLSTIRGKDRAHSRQVARSTLFILQQLVTKDFKLKYRRSVLGVVWSVLNPLLMMAVMTLVFSNMFKFPIENYPLYLILGSVLFAMMNDATTGAMSSIIEASSLIKKVKIKKAVFPIEKAVFALVNFALSLVAVAAVMLFFHIRPTLSMLALPIILIYVVLFSIGLGLALSALSVFFRDIMHLWSVIITAWNYLTPIFWPQDFNMFLVNLSNPALAEILMSVERFNPMYHYVVYFRDIMMYGNMPGLGENLVCLGFAVVTFLVGVAIFAKTQHKFILYI